MIKFFRNISRVQSVRRFFCEIPAENKDAQANVQKTDNEVPVHLRPYDAAKY